MFDAWAGLLISPPHHQLAASHSVSQTTEFVVICRARGLKREGECFHVVLSTDKQLIALYASCLHVYYVMCLSLCCLIDLLVSCDMCHL